MLPLWIGGLVRFARSLPGRIIHALLRRESLLLFARALALVAVFIYFFLGAVPLRAANEPAAEPVEELTVESAIAKAMRNNPTMVGAVLGQELNEITYLNARDNMFMPKFSITSSTKSAYTVGQVPGSAAKLPNAETATGNLEHGTPASTRVALAMGEYTLYNFGKDRDAYESTKMTWERSRQKLKETERDVRFSVIKEVYSFMTKQDLLDISQRATDQAEAVYELIKSRIPIGKAQQSDLDSAGVDLLGAKNKLVEDQLTYTQALWSLNKILGDPIGHKYEVKAKIKFSKFKMKLEDGIRLYKERAPAIIDAKLSLDQARITLRTAKKNFLPLPTVTFSGITIGHDMGPRQSTKVRESTGGTSGNLDISASVSLTIPLTGDGGIFNHRAYRAAEIAEEQSEIALRTTANDTEISVRTAFSTITKGEESLKNQEEIFKKAASVFDTSLKNLQSGTTFDRLDLKDAIKSLREAEQGYTQAILDNYSAKLELAKLLGVDELPEEKK